MTHQKILHIHTDFTVHYSSCLDSVALRQHLAPKVPPHSGKPFGDDYLRHTIEGTEWDEPDSYRSRHYTVKPIITRELKGTFKSLSAILAPEGGVLLNEALENEGEEIGIDEYDAGDIDES